MNKIEEFMKLNALSEQEVLELLFEYSNKSIIEVDYRKPLENALILNGLMIRNVEIGNDSFPNNPLLKGKKKILTKLFVPETAETETEAITRMKNEGYRPATFIELVSIHRGLSDYQRQFSIFALGSPFLSRLNNHVYPFINKEGANLSRCSYPEKKIHRLLAVLIEK